MESTRLELFSLAKLLGHLLHARGSVMLSMKSAGLTAICCDDQDAD
jgi:hypothetical protein